MSWAKVDDRLHGHIKAQRAGEAMALWVLALSWCCAYMTDGEVPEEIPRRLLGRKGDKFAKRLVDAKLWVKSEFGYTFLSWDEYQTSRVTVEAKRAEAKARMQRTRGVSSDVRANSERTSSEQNANTSRSSREVRVPKSDTKSESESDTEKRSERGAREALAHPAPQPKSDEGKRSKRKPAPVETVDAAPLPGTPERKVYDAIVGDKHLGPITGAPGDLAHRLVALCAGSRVDPVREVIALGAYAADHPGHWTDGRAAILRNVKRKVDEDAQRPKPASATQSSAKGPSVPAPAYVKGPPVPHAKLAEARLLIARAAAPSTTPAEPIGEVGT